MIKFSHSIILICHLLISTKSTSQDNYLDYHSKVIECEQQIIEGNYEKNQFKSYGFFTLYRQLCVLSTYRYKVTSSSTNSCRRGHDSRVWARTCRVSFTFPQLLDRKGSFVFNFFDDDQLLPVGLNVFTSLFVYLLITFLGFGADIRRSREP